MRHDYKTFNEEINGDPIKVCVEIKEVDNKFSTVTSNDLRNFHHHKSDGTFIHDILRNFSFLLAYSDIESSITEENTLILRIKLLIAQNFDMQRFESIAPQDFTLYVPYIKQTLKSLN